MNWNYNEIKAEILSEWGQLTETSYPEDLLQEWADSAVPVYYGDIIKDWQEMPSEYADTWQDLAPDMNSVKITTLMTYDLYNYYSATYLEIYEEIKAKKESEND